MKHLCIYRLPSKQPQFTCWVFSLLTWGLVRGKFRKCGNRFQFSLYSSPFFFYQNYNDLTYVEINDRRKNCNLVSIYFNSDCAIPIYRIKRGAATRDLLKARLSRDSKRLRIDENYSISPSDEIWVNECLGNVKFYIRTRRFLVCQGI